MGNYRNPNTTAKAYRKKAYEHYKYQNEHRDKERAKQADKKNKYSKNCKKKIIEKIDKKHGSKSEKKNLNTVVTKKPKTIKKTFKPCAKTIAHFDICRNNDKGIFIIIPIKFKFLSNKLDNVSVNRLFNFIIHNGFVYTNIRKENKGGVVVFKDSEVFKKHIAKKWKKNFLKLNLKKIYKEKNCEEIGFIKYDHRWYFAIDIGRILFEAINYKLQYGHVTYKYIIEGLLEESGSVAILNKNGKLIKRHVAADIIPSRDDDKIQIFWNDKDNYGELCKIYHEELRKVNGDKMKFDCSEFYNKVKMMIEFTEIIVKTSPRCKKNPVRK